MIFSKYNNYKKRTAQEMVEYALVLALVSVVVASVMTYTGINLRNVFTTIIQTFSNATGID